MTEGPGWVRFTHTVPSVNNPRAAHSDRPNLPPARRGREVEVEVGDWGHIGNGQTGGPMLRVAFDTNLRAPVATYEIRSGRSRARPTARTSWASTLDGPERGRPRPGRAQRLEARDVGGGEHDAPDPDPLQLRPRSSAGRRPAPLALRPGAPRGRAGAPRASCAAGWSSSSRSLAATVPADAKGPAPAEWSPVRVTDPAVVPTVLKMAKTAAASSSGCTKARSAVPGAIEFGFPARTAVGELRRRTPKARPPSQRPHPPHPAP